MQIIAYILELIVRKNWFAYFQVRQVDFTIYYLILDTQKTIILISNQRRQIVSCKMQKCPTNDSIIKLF